MSRIAVIIPTWNEAVRIGDTLRELEAIVAVDSIVVSDGGSTDGTVSICNGRGVRVVRAPRGRGRQMNAAAKVTRADVLVFLHADVSLPADALQSIERALARSDVVAGAFRTWTVPDPASRFPPLLLHLADLRSRYATIPYGDQALFVRKDAFVKVGGFPEQPLMEDIEIGRRLLRIGRIVTVPAYVRVSGRRFQARPFYYTTIINLFPWLYRFGVGPDTLSRLYGDVR